MNRIARWIVVAVIALVAGGSSAAPRESLEVQLSAPDSVLWGDVDVAVNVTVTNPARHPVHVLRWQLPSDEPDGALFRIVRDGEKVGYLGPVFKRTAPEAADLVRLDPGESLQFEVELTATYDLSRSGLYTVEYVTRGAHGAHAVAMRSNTLYLSLLGRSGSAKRPQPPPPPNPGPISFQVCSTSQQSALTAAVDQAKSYSADAITYLAGQVGDRYTWWFGTWEAAHQTTVKNHFQAVQDAFSHTDALSFNCKCRQRNVYAYVYPSLPYTIYLCGAYWVAAAVGTDSQAGTLIHEMSHFTVVAGTDDYVYGQSGCHALALSDPDEAIDNADSHEYFAENNPPRN